MLNDMRRCDTPAEHDGESIPQRRIRHARQTAAALERVGRERTPESIAALHELHACHLRELGDEDTARRADERAAHARRLAAAPHTPSFVASLPTAGNAGGPRPRSARLDVPGKPGGRSREAGQLQVGQAGVQRADSALRRAVAGSERAGSYEVRAKAGRERSAAATRRIRAAEDRAAASGLRSPLGGSDRADERDRIADERERIADEREWIADERDRHADLRDKVADRREKTADEREKAADKRSRDEP